MSSYTHWKVAQDGVRLDRFLSRVSGLSRAFIQHQVKSGHVRVNGMPAEKPSLTVKEGDEISAQFQEKVFPLLEPVEGSLDIVYEDKELLALNKPQGLVVHPASGHQGITLVHYLLHYLRTEKRFLSLDETRPGIIHRLDRGTTGILLVAKSRRAQEELSRQFKMRETKKEYECLVWGRVSMPGVSDAPVGRHRWDRTKMSTKSPVGREAKTEWRPLDTFPHFSHLEVLPQTGRTHQIRVHLAEKGFPIVGDALYETRSLQGKKTLLDPELAKRIEAVPHTFLHARALTFTHPVSGQRIRVEAALPHNFEDFLKWLKEREK